MTAKREMARRETSGTPLVPSANEAKVGGGDPRTAALVALASPHRPSVFLDTAPERSPWVSLDAIKAKGAVLVWPTADTAGTPPPALKQRFPDLVPEVPRAFERRVQGRLPLLRMGWAVVRPGISSQ